MTLLALVIAAVAASGCLGEADTASHHRGRSAAALCAARARHAVVTAISPDAAVEHDWARYAASGKGWVAGDSIYSYSVRGLGTLDTLSDSFLYSMATGARLPIVHNLFVVQTSSGFRTVTRGTPAHPASLLAAPAGSFYLGFGGIDEGRSFQQYFIKARWWGPGTLDYSIVQTVLATFALPSLRLESVRQTSGAHTPIRWGASIERFGDWTYVYGTRNGHLGLGPGYVARLRGDTLLTRWSYWDGHGWSPSVAAARPIVGAADTQYSVTRYDGMYVLVTSDPYPAFSPDAHIYFGCSATGPFVHSQQFTLSDYVGPPGRQHWGGRSGDNYVYVYDAMAQPVLAHNGDLVVSYDQNDIRFSAIFGTPDIYRPGYLDVTIWTGSG